MSGLQKKIYIALQSLKLIMEARVLGKPPNPSTPSGFTSLRFGLRSINSTTHQFFQTYPRVRKYKNPPMVSTRGLNYARGFHISI